MVGNVVAVGAAEPFVDVAAVARVFPVAAYAPHGAVTQRERGLKSPAERRHGRFGHHGVALHGPDRHAEQADGRTLLPQNIAQGAYNAPVEVVVLYGMTVLVGHELFVPRHRIAVDRGRGEELHTFREVHHQSVRLEIFGVHDEGNTHRTVTESERNVGPDGTDVEQRTPRHGRNRIGIDHPHVGRTDRAPFQPRGVRTPRIVLGRSLVRETEGAQQEEDMQQPLHLRTGFFAAVAALGEYLDHAVAVVALNDDLTLLGRAADAAFGFQQTRQAPADPHPAPRSL